MTFRGTTLMAITELASYAVVRPQILTTVLNFLVLKSYTVQIRIVHCQICKAGCSTVQDTIPAIFEI